METQRVRRTTEEWRQILSSQREQEQTDAEWAQVHGVSVSSLRSWRQKFKNAESIGAGVKLVEIPSFGSSVSLQVILPNGIRLEVPTLWPLEHLGQVVGLLRSL